MARNPEKQREAKRRHYERNRAAVIARAKVGKRESHARARAVIEAAKDTPCADCHTKYPTCVMDFDHVRGTKLFNLGDAARRGLGVQTVLAEIAKCDVICANCHRIRTHMSV